MNFKNKQNILSGFILCCMLICGSLASAQTFPGPPGFFNMSETCFVSGGTATCPGVASSSTTTTGFNSTTSVTNLTVTVTLNHTFASDVELVLVAPNGRGIMLLNDQAGGNDFVNTTLTFSDAATITGAQMGNTTVAAPPGLLMGTVIQSGTVRPIAGGGGQWNLTTLAALLATMTGDQFNGQWRVIGADDAGGIVGNFTNVQLNFTSVTGSPGVCTLTCPGNQYFSLAPGECTIPYTWEMSITNSCLTNGALQSGFANSFAPAAGYNINNNDFGFGLAGLAFPGFNQFPVGNENGGAPASIAIRSLGLDFPAPPNNFYSIQMQFWQIPTNGTISFDWSYQSNDTTAGDDPAGYYSQPHAPGDAALLGEFTQLTANAGGVTQSGSGSIGVFKDHFFGYFCRTINFDVPLARITLSNFSFVPAAQPPVLTQVEGPNVGSIAQFNQLIAVESGDFEPGTTTVRYTGTTANGQTPLSCEFDVTVNELANPLTEMSCNDLINISLDENCSATVTPDMVLEGGPYGCYDDFIVQLGTSMTGPFNLGNTLSCANIGQTLAVKVINPANNNTCWGWILVEDKMVPEVECGLCEDEVNEISGIIEFVTDPQASGFNGACYDYGAGPAQAGPHPYDFYTFEVPVTGTYSFEIVSDGPVVGGQSTVGVYTDFDDQNVCNNLIGGCDEFVVGTFTVNLTAGETYDMVILDYAGNPVIEFTEYVMTVEGPNGEPIALQIPCEIACTDLAALQAVNSIDDFADLGIDLPIVTDNCTGIGTCEDVELTFSIGAPTSTDMCEEGRTIPITWIATDAYGGVGTCVVNVVITIPTLEDVVFPDAIVVECGNGYAPEDLSGLVNEDVEDGNTLDEDWPKVNGNDIKVGGDYCNLAITYTDTEIPLCGSTKKIVRRWLVADWCTQETIESTQLIKYGDSDAPGLACPSPNEAIIINASQYACAAFNVVLPAPLVAEDLCSSFIVEVLLNGTVITTAAEGYLVRAGVELPVGSYDIIYRATDACGNVNECTQRITVRDVTPPNIICKEFLQVTLNPNGCVNKVPANRFDNGSYDNCCKDADLVFKVRRLGEPAALERDTITFSDCDLSNTVANPYNEGKACGRVDVILAVYCKGSPTVRSECMVQSFVDDKTVPVVTAPANVTVHCESHTNPTAFFGEFTWSDGCGFNYEGACPTGNKTLNVVVNDQFNELDECGEGVVRRTVTVSDKCGNTTSRTQTVTVRHVSDFIVNFPPDQMFTTCTDTLDLSPIVNSADPKKWPQFEGDECENLATSYWDERFYGENEACFKVVRHWKVINWCKYEIGVNDHDDIIQAAWRINEFRPSQNTTTSFVNYNSVPLVGHGLRDDTSWRPGEFRRIQDGGTDIDNTGDGVIEYVQILKVKDNTKPQIRVKLPNNCPTPNGDEYIVNEYVDLVTPAPTGANPCPSSNSSATPVVFNVVGQFVNGVCVAPANILAASATDCSTKLTYSYWLDANADAANPCAKTIDFQQNNASVVPYQIPMGLHRIYWEVNDNCGNKDAGNYWVLVKDCKQPTPVCFHGISTVVMPTSGSITLPISYFNHGSFDNCTAPENLRFSYSADVNDTEHTWTCADIVANGSIQFQVTMYVTDADGNQDFCTTFINVNTNGVCPPINEPLVSGNVLTYANGTTPEGLSAVKIFSDDAFKVLSSTSNGEYIFGTADEATPVKVTTKHDFNYRNGVDVADIIKIQNHILGKVSFDQAYKMIAADVVEDGKIDARDLIEIKKVILGKTDAFTSGNSWRAFDASFNLNMDNWKTAPRTLDVKGRMNVYAYDVDFNAVKMGDVDNTAKASVNSQVISQRSVGSLNFRVDEQNIEAGKVIEVPVKAKDFKNINGYQFTFEFDQNVMEYAGVKFGALDLSSNDFGINKANEGIVTTLFENSSSVELEDDAVLFTLVFNGKEATKLSSSLKANSKVTPAIGLRNGNEQLDINLEFMNGNVVVAKEFELLQNTPNPFSSMTSIAFNLPEAGKAKLTIYDVTGKVITQKIVDGSKGANSVNITRAELKATGVMFYQLSAGDNSATKKMVIID